MKATGEPSPGFVFGAHPGNRLFDRRFQNAQIDVVEAVDVKAALPGLVPAKPGQQFRAIAETGKDIDAGRLLARAETRQKPAMYPGFGIGAAVLAEPDNARSPHAAQLTRNARHQGIERKSVGAAPFVLNAADKGCNRTSVRWVFNSAITAPQRLLGT